MSVLDGRFELSLGGLRFEVATPAGVAVVEENPTYREFVTAGAAGNGEVVPVALRLGGAPALDPLPLLFDTEATWSAHRDGDDVLLRLRTLEAGAGGDPFLWVARLPETPGRDAPVEVFCGGRLAAGPGRLHNPLHYPLDQLLAIFLLPHRGGLLCHAAGVALGERGAILAGRSGAGKSTFTRLAAARPQLARLSDDRVILRRRGTSTRVHGTPWAGEGQVAANREAELAALVFLHQAPLDELREIAPKDALEQLLPVTSIPWFDAGRAAASLEQCGRLVESVPAYELRFRPHVAAVDLVVDLLARAP